MSDRFEDEEYLSWLKLSLALIYTKEALESFTDREVLTFHNQLKASILGAHGLSSTALPTCCSPTCTHIQLKKQWFQGKFNCPGNVCDKWIKYISMHHQFPRQVVWENVNVSKLPLVPWECMKLYLPFGYQRQSTVQEFDLAALLSVYLNCRHFDNFFADPVIPCQDICKQVKEVRNGVMHSGQMKIDTRLLIPEVAKLKTLLQDSKHLINDTDCQKGVRKIEKLMAERLELWLNKELELRALNSRMQALEDTVEQMQNEYKDISNKLNTVSEDVEELKKDRAELKKVKEDYGALKNSVEVFTRFIEKHKIQKVDTNRLLQCESKLTSLSERVEQTLKQHEQTLLEHEQTIEKQGQKVQEHEQTLKQQGQKVQEHEQTIQKQGQKVQEHEQTLQQQGQKVQEHDQTLHQQGQAVQEHEQRLEGLEKRDKPAKTSAIECSPEDVQKLQQNVMELYRKRFMWAQNPILPEEEIPLDDIYVEPDIRVLRERCGQSPLKDLHQRQASELSCKQIFQTGSYKCENIYITGDAGTGKSILCKSIVNKWLKSHSSDTISDNEISAGARLFQYTRDWNKQKLKKRGQTLFCMGYALKECCGKIESDEEDIYERVWDELFWYIRGCNKQKKEDGCGEKIREEGYVAQLFWYIRDLYKNKLDERRCEKINDNVDMDIRDQVLAELGRYIRGWNEQKIEEQPGEFITDEEDRYIEKGVWAWRQWSMHLHKKNYEERHGENKTDEEDKDQDKSVAEEIFECIGHVFDSDQEECYAKNMFEYISGSSNVQELEELLKHKEEDRGILKEFTLVFCISLRDSMSECNITAMIQSQYLLQYADTRHLDADSVLKNEKCLVILDGLDEWECPENKSLPRFSNPGIPGRDLLNKNVVILTTTRPWKFDVLRLKTNELDKHVDLCGLGEYSAKYLSYMVIKMLNSSHNGSMCGDAFWSTLQQKSLGHFKSNPVLLIQLICLWFDRKGLSESQVALYSSVLDLLLERAEKHLPEETHVSTRTIYVRVSLPNCFLEKYSCQLHKELFLCLSKLAFESLFNENKEQSLVFPSSKAEHYGITQADIMLCLKCGILSQSKVLGLSANRLKRLSFLHKTFQEFLAALYIVMSDNHEEVMARITSICKTIDSCLEVSKVFMFVSGLNPEIASDLLKHFSYKVKANKIILAFRHMAASIPYNPILVDIQKCYVECLSECHNSGHSYDDLCHTVEYVAISSKTICPELELLVKKTGSNIKYLYLNPSNISSKQKQITDTIIERLDMLEMLSIGDFSKFDSPWAICRSESVDLLIDDTIMSIVNNCRNTITCVELKYVDLHSLGDRFPQLFSTMTVLKSLSVEGVTLTHEQIVGLLAVISQHALKDIRLWRLECKNRSLDWCASLDLQGLPNNCRNTITCVELKYVDLHSLGDRFPQLFSTMTVLKSLSVEGVTLTHEQIVGLLAVISQHALKDIRLWRLECKNHSLDWCASLDLQGLPNIQTLELSRMMVDNLHTLSGSVRSVVLEFVAVPVSSWERFESNLSDSPHQFVKKVKVITRNCFYLDVTFKRYDDNDVNIQTLELQRNENVNTQ